MNKNLKLKCLSFSSFVLLSFGQLHAQALTAREEQDLMHTIEHSTFKEVTLEIKKHTNEPKAFIKTFRASYGYTLLEAAASSGKSDIVRLLLQMGAKPTILSLRLAIDFMNVEAVKLLLVYGADPNAIQLDWQGNEITWKLLHLIANRDFEYQYVLKIIAILLQFGADPMAVDASGNTALGIARQPGNKDVIAILEKAMKEAILKQIATDNQLAVILQNQKILDLLVKDLVFTRLLHLQLNPMSPINGLSMDGLGKKLDQQRREREERKEPKERKESENDNKKSDPNSRFAKIAKVLLGESLLLWIVDLINTHWVATKPLDNQSKAD